MKPHCRWLMSPPPPAASRPVRQPARLSFDPRKGIGRPGRIWLEHRGRGHLEGSKRGRKLDPLLARTVEHWARGTRGQGVGFDRAAGVSRRHPRLSRGTRRFVNVGGARRASPAPKRAHPRPMETAWIQGSRPIEGLTGAHALRPRRGTAAEGAPPGPRPQRSPLSGPLGCATAFPTAEGRVPHHVSTTVAGAVGPACQSVYQRTPHLRR